MFGDDVGDVGVDGPPTLELLCEDTNEAEDNAASMVASIDPEVAKERSPIEGVSGSDCEWACWARNALASSASKSSGGRRSFSISDFRLGGDERGLEKNKRRRTRLRNLKWHL